MGTNNDMAPTILKKAVKVKEKMAKVNSLKKLLNLWDLHMCLAFVINFCYIMFFYVVIITFDESLLKSCYFMLL